MSHTNQNIIPFGLIKTCFQSEHIPAIIKGQETHDPILRLIGQVVPYTQEKADIHRLIGAVLPHGYSGNSEVEIDEMIEGALKKGFAEPAQKKSKSAAAILLNIIESMDNIELFHDFINQPYINVPTENGGKRTILLSSTEAKRWLKKQYYDVTGNPITTQGFIEALATIEAKAVYEGERKDVHLRIARYKQGIYIHIGDKSGQAIEIDKSGYRVLPYAPIPFLQSDAMAALPLPVKSGNRILSEFQELLSLDDRILHRVLAFLIGCFKPEGPYLCFITEGEQGSGKSFLNMIIKKLVDPSPALKLRLPREERELMIIAKQFHLLVFDNISSIRNDISDVLCSLSTGGGFPARKLFTDEEIKIFSECRPFILNGISGITHRPDLLDRSISVRLPTMPADKRKTEGKLTQRFEEMLPQLFDWLLRVISMAIARYDDVEPPKNIRMADAAKWLMAAEPATGLPEGSLINALQASQEEIIKETMERNSLAVTINKLLETRGEFEGTVGDLLAAIESVRPKYDQYFPTTPSYLSKELDRLKPALKVAGIIIEFGPKKNYGKTVRIWRDERGDFDAPHINEPIAF